MTKTKGKESEMTRPEKPETIETAVVATDRRSLFERVAGWLDAQDWHYDAHPERKVITFGISSREVTYRVLLDVSEAEVWNRVLVGSTYPVRVPPAKRGTVLEALNRINYVLIFGNFEMDMEDGEIRCRTSAESDAPLDDTMIERAIGANLSLMDRWFAPLMAIAYGGTDAAKVLDLARQEPEGTLQ